MLFLISGSKNDPFNDQVDNAGAGAADSSVHIRIQQRNGRKTLTTVQGLNPDYDLKKIVKVCKKVDTLSALFYNCVTLKSLFRRRKKTKCIILKFQKLTLHTGQEKVNYCVVISRCYNGL